MAMNPYEILGIPEGSTLAEVKRAYRKKARENHPDLNPGDEQAAKRMNQINEAYDRIINPDKYAAEDARRAAAEGRAYGGNTTNQYGGGTTQRQSYTGGSSQYQGAGQDGQYGWSGDFGFGFEDLFGGFATSSEPVHPEPSATDSAEIVQAIQYVNSKQFKQATKVLYKVKSTDRNARWYYIIALANQGLGNTMLAADQIKKACEMDPNNQDFKRAARNIQSSGRTYQQTSQSRGFSMGFMDPSTLCCICLGLNMCLGGGFGARACMPY